MPDLSKKIIKPRLDLIGKERLIEKNLIHKAILSRNHANNIIPKYPTNEGVVVHAGKKYGEPEYRFKKRGGGAGIPESDSFWFEKKDNNEVVLHLILEAYRENQDEIPLNMKNISLALNYKQGTEVKSLPLTVKQTPFVKAVNILKDIHAEAVIPAFDVDSVVSSLTSDNGIDATITVDSEIWWQKPTQNQQPTTSFTGEWKTTYGIVRLIQNGTKITGDYDVGKGPFVGSVRGNRFTGTFVNNGMKKTGEVYWNINGNNINGKWRWKGSGNWLPWTGTKISSKKPKLKYTNTKKPAETWTGTWGSNHGPLRLVQQGNMVYGDYAKVNGTIEAKIVRNMLRGVFTNNGKPGIFEWKMNGQKFTGNWKWRGATKWSGAWNGQLKSKTKPTLTSKMKSKIKFIPILDTRLVGRILTPLSTASTAVNKVNHQYTINVSFDRNDQQVFGDLVGSFISEEYKWIPKRMDKDGEVYDIFYRATNKLDEFCFLPQVFRIQVSDIKPEPKMSIAMQSDDAADLNKYKILVTMQIAPYFHPNAKKDLYETISLETAGSVKYPKLSFKGYKKARFVVDPAYGGENSVFRGKVNENVDEINPSTGFNLSVECNFESFDYLKRELIDGITIGHVIFDLEQHTSEGEEVVQSQQIPVELNLRKLTGFHIPNTVIETVEDWEDLQRFKEDNQDSENGDQEDEDSNGGNKKFIDKLLDFLDDATKKREEEQENQEGEDEEESVLPTAPYGTLLTNPYNQELEIGNVSITLLSEVGDLVYDVDLDIETGERLWPTSIMPAGIKPLPLDQNDVDTIDDETRVWTHLQVEPYSVKFTTDPEAVLGKIIDYASGDFQEWNLRIECGVFANWDRISAEDREKYNDISRIEVQIKKPSGEVEGVLLSHDEPSKNLSMSRSLSEILNSQQTDDKKYATRQKNIYLINEGDWSEWQELEETTSVDNLWITPIIETE